MLRFVLILGLILAPRPCLAEDPAPSPGKPAKAPIEGIHWEEDLEAGLLRASREGRPVLFCINALFGQEGANTRLGSVLYRSAAWGRATRGYVAFVCNPADSDGPDGLSTAYEGISSASAKAALQYVLDRFGSDQISPQHIILEPDGDVAYRKEYYTGEVGPGLLDSWLAFVSPPIARQRAGLDRAKQIERLKQAPTEKLAAHARNWLMEGDGLAAAGVLDVLIDEYDTARRLALIGALASAPVQQQNVLEFGAEETATYPDDDEAVTLAWARALLRSNRPSGIWMLSRAMARTESADLRGDLLRIWVGRQPGQPVPRLAELSPDEQERAREALLLAGDKRADEAGGLKPSDKNLPWRLARAVSKRAGTPRWPALAEALEDEQVAVVRGSLMEADAASVLGVRSKVEALLMVPGQRHVALAAALALLRAGKTAEKATVIALLLGAIQDEIEGPEVRAALMARLGEDLGLNVPGWRSALDARVQEVAK
jgi:hypothetical protein